MAQTTQLLTTREFLIQAQQFTNTNYFPQLLPEEEPSKEEIAKTLAEHKASVDKLSRPFSIHKNTLDKGQPQSPRWIWEGRIPLEGLTLLNGAHGTGKSTLAHQIGAAVSSNRRMPD